IHAVGIGAQERVLPDERDSPVAAELSLGNGGLAGNWGIPLVGQNTLLGTDADGVNDCLERNVISGQPRGVGVFGSYNHIAGNSIGTTSAGASMPCMAEAADYGQVAGVTFWDGSHDNWLGVDSKLHVAPSA